MNIVILAGGTGSIALQKGLYDLIDKNIEGVDTKVIVNAYDNGLSTGAVRRVLNGDILGPSDVRKNQTTRFELENSVYVKPYLKFLNHRFTEYATSAKYLCNKLRTEAYIELCNTEGVDKAKVTTDTVTIEYAINAYFDKPSATRIDYDDFSVANIIYAGLAAMHGNSLRKAASVMADILGIKDNVLLNDDNSLFLGAVTKSGKKLTDEGDIVSWNTPGDPIIDIFFTDAHGREDKPFLNAEAYQAILDADLIIMSSGTQWSSLIPTYASDRFDQAIRETNAKVLMVMNRVPDKDAPDQSASDIIKTLVPKYFPEGRIEVIVDEAGDSIMNHVDEDAAKLVKAVNYFNLSPSQFEEKISSKHNPTRLAKAIIKTYFKNYLDAKAYIFDFDDTLVGRGNSFPLASAFNTQKLATAKQKVMICSGNGIKAINLKGLDALTAIEHEVQPITVFADGGINEYSYDPCRTANVHERRFSYVRCLDEAAKFDSKGPNSIDSIVTSLCAAGIPVAKIENRGDVMVTIKPIDPEYREIVRNLVERICAGSGFEVKTSGRTTIEINKAAVRKDVAMREVLKTVYGSQFVVYIGDELTRGNDVPVADMAKLDPRIRCLEVKNPAHTALLMMAISKEPTPII